MSELVVDCVSGSAVEDIVLADSVVDAVVDSVAVAVEVDSVVEAVVD